MTHDEAERIVDDSVPADQIWAGHIVPPAWLRIDTTARDNMRSEVVAERAQRAQVRVRVRFVHLSQRTRYQRRRDGTWAPADHDLERDGPQGTEAIKVDMEAPVTRLTEGLVSHHFVSRGKTTTREVTRPDDGSDLVEWVSQSISGFVDLRADPFEGPHGLIRLFARVRNTTETLTAIGESDEARAHSLVGCHLILMIDKGKLIDPEHPSSFAEPYVARCESEGVRSVIVGDRARILLSSATPA